MGPINLLLVAVASFALLSSCSDGKTATPATAPAPSTSSVVPPVKDDAACQTNRQIEVCLSIDKTTVTPTDNLILTTTVTNNASEPYESLNPGCDQPFTLLNNEKADYDILCSGEFFDSFKFPLELEPGQAIQSQSSVPTYVFKEGTNELQTAWILGDSGKVTFSYDATATKPDCAKPGADEFSYCIQLEVSVNRQGSTCDVFADVMSEADLDRHSECNEESLDRVLWAGPDSVAEVQGKLKQLDGVFVEVDGPCDLLQVTTGCDRPSGPVPRQPTTDS